MNYKPVLQQCIFMCIALCAAIPLLAQDTARISIQDAEKIFLDKNLQLLSEKYNVDMARAAVLQARLYNNPSVSVSTALYNQEQKKWLDVSNATGQYGISAQQLIILAGKRNKQI